MSVKTNGLKAVAAAALVLTLTAGAAPVAYGLINDYSIKAVGIAEVTDKGQCVVVITMAGALVTDPDVVRVIGTTSGDVRVFGDLAAAMAVVKNAKLTGNAVVTVKRREKTGSVGDPIATLKKRFLSFKKERDSAVVIKTELTAEKVAGEALGYQNEVGTPERAYYDDLIVKISSVEEWRAFSDAQVVALAAALTAAGVDPLTVT